MGDATIATLPLDEGFEGTVNRTWIETNLSPTAVVVAAIVTYDEPTESFSKYASYRLEVTDFRREAAACKHLRASSSKEGSS